MRTTTGGFRLPFRAYDAISARCDRLGTDAFQLRHPFGPPITFMRGEPAARLFYDQRHIQRTGAVPGRVLKTLLGKGGVQTLDGDAHRHRKHMMMSLMTPPARTELVETFTAGLDRRIDRWERTGGQVTMYDAMGHLLCETVCAWAGVPLAAQDVARRTRDLHHLIETPAALGLAHWQGRYARGRAERWAGGLIEQARRGEIDTSPGRALRVIAEHRELDGSQLDTRTAAVELLNMLRPTVAVDRFIVFVACALHEHPRWAQALRDADPDDNTLVERFVHEVRRLYPFFPIQGARVRQPFTWRNLEFTPGGLVVLDLYGTNHHASSWPEPSRFDPDRFAGWDGSPYNFVPQGGGDHATGHRCSGEWATIDLMGVAVRALTRWMEYDVPLQDLRLSRRKVPALPNSRFVIERVRRRQRPDLRQPLTSLAREPVRAG
jgi:fatty-acid peroxygenase